MQQPVFHLPSLRNINQRHNETTLVVYFNCFNGKQHPAQCSACIKIHFQFLCLTPLLSYFIDHFLPVLLICKPKFNNCFPYGICALNEKQLLKCFVGVQQTAIGRRCYINSNGYEVQYLIEALFIVFDVLYMLYFRGFQLCFSQLLLLGILFQPLVAGYIFYPVYYVQHFVIITHHRCIQRAPKPFFKYAIRPPDIIFLDRHNMWLFIFQHKIK